MSEVTAEPQPAAPAGAPGQVDPPQQTTPPGETVTTRGVPPRRPAAASAHRADDRRAAWRESLRVGFWTWLAGIIMYALITMVNWLPFGEAPAIAKSYEAWHRWDTTWYVIIADSGYTWDKRAAAFFPLYPLLTRWANPFLPGGSFEAALILSVLACLAALVLIHRLVAELVESDLAKRTIFYLLAFPTGFYLVAAYNESLYIALVAGALYCMRRRHWWLAGVLAGFASGTRMLGVLLGASFLYEYLRQCGFSPRRIRWDLLWILLTPSGLLFYALYNWRVLGDPLYFEKMQINWFHGGFQAPWTTLLQVSQLVAQTHPILSPDSIRNIYNLTTAIVWLALLAVALDRKWGLGKEQAYLVIFSAGVILAPLVNPIAMWTRYPLSSMWRFALECIPVFMVLAKMGRNARFDRVYTMAALGLQGVMVLTFLHDQFVA